MLNPSLSVRTEGDLLIAEFWDCLRLDPEPVKELRTAFESHSRKTKGTTILVDLSGVGFAGSAALGGFLALRRQGARVIFFNVDPTVREVFHISKLESLFQFVPDLAAALTHARTNESASGQTNGDASKPDAPVEKPARPRSAPPLARRPRGGTR